MIMFGPITERDFLNPFSNFNTDLMLMGAIFLIVFVIIHGICRWVQERYEDSDKDPFDGPHVV